MAAPKVNGAVEYGFVPRQVVNDLLDAGDWKMRVAALESLRRALREVSDRSQLVPNLSRFTAFLMALVAESNFKVALSAMAALGDLVVKLGRDIEPQLRIIVAGLVDKLSASQVLVRGGTVAVLRKLLAAAAPRAVVEHLLVGLTHSNERVREEVLHTLIVVMLSHPRDSLDMPRIFTASVERLRDPRDTVQGAALEALAVLNSRIGPSEFLGLLQRSGMADGVRTQVHKRLSNPHLPRLGPDGELIPAAAAPVASLANHKTDSAPLLLSLGDAFGDKPISARPMRRATSINREVAAPPADAGMPSEGGWGYDLMHLARKPRSDNGGGPVGLQPHDAAIGGVPTPSRAADLLNPNLVRRDVSKLGLLPWPTASGGGGSGTGQTHSSPTQQYASSSGNNGYSHQQSPTQSLFSAAAGSGHSYSAKVPVGASRSTHELHLPTHHDGPLSPSRTSAGGSYHSLLKLTQDPGSCVPYSSELRAQRSSPSALLSSRQGSARGGAGAGAAADAMASWRHAMEEAEHDSGTPRLETFSPSKSEMLDKLKRRQQEKRGSQAGSFCDSFASNRQWDECPVGGQHGVLSSASCHDLSSLTPVPAPTRSVAGPLGAMLKFFSTNTTNTNSNGGNGKASKYLYTEDSVPVPRAARPGNLSTGRMPPPPPPAAAAAATPSWDPLDMANRPKPPRDPSICHSNAASRSFGGANLGDPPTAAGLASMGGSGAGGALWGNEYKAASGLNELAAEQLTAVSDPDKCMRNTLATLTTANNAGRMDLDWQAQHEALNDARRLVRHHPDTVQAHLHDIVRAAIPAVDMLRSTTSKNSLLLFQELFQALGRSVDKELDEIVPILVKKSGEVSTAGRENFLVGEADRTLGVMCHNCSEARCVAALMACAQHKSPTVRAKVASHLDTIVESSLGRSVLQPVMERLFKCAAAFLDEGALEARTYGKRIVWNLKAALGKAEFDRLAMGVSPASTKKKVMETVENCNGPPPAPNKGGPAAGRGGSRQLHASPSMETRDVMDRAREANSMSAPVGPDFGRLPRSCSDGDRRSGVTPERRLGLSAYQSRNSSVADILAAAAASPTRVLDRMGSSKARSGGGGEQMAGATAEALQRAIGQLGAKDVRERMEAVQALDGLVSALPGAADSTVIALLDGLGGRLNDGNSKISLQALETLGRVFAVLRDRVVPGLHTLVPALTTSLGSTNDKVRSVGSTAVDALIANVDAAFLVQNFSHCASNGVVRGKPLLVDKLITIIKLLYPVRPQLVVKYAVPTALSLANDTKGEVKASSAQLLACLARILGDGLMDHAATLSPALQQRVAEALAMARR